MRTPNYLSPTSIALFESDREAFYLNYLADTRTPRMPQTQPMAAGSAVDAYIKSYLHESIFGIGADARFEFDTLFEEQVEAHNRDWARVHGKYLFEVYQESGALADFAIELAKATQEPQFEFTIESRVAHELVSDGVPLLGKPDVSYWINDLLVVRDWKVNGYCANRVTSPKKGYVNIRPGNKAHKDAIVTTNRHGVTENINHSLNDIDLSWARQIAIYGWVLGAPVGSDFLASIEQFACSGPMNEIRIALYRSTVCPHYQTALHDTIGKIWAAILSGHIFTDLSIEENDNKIDLLNRVSQDPTEAWLHNQMKEQKFGY